MFLQDSSEKKSKEHHGDKISSFGGVLGAIIDKTLKKDGDKEQEPKGITKKDGDKETESKGITNPKLSATKDDYTAKSKAEGKTVESKSSEGDEEFKESHLYKMMKKHERRKNRTSEHSHMKKDEDDIKGKCNT